MQGSKILVAGLTHHRRFCVCVCGYIGFLLQKIKEKQGSMPTQWAKQDGGANHDKQDALKPNACIVSHLKREGRVTNKHKPEKKGTRINCNTPSDIGSLH